MGDLDALSQSLRSLADRHADEPDLDNAIELANRLKTFLSSLRSSSAGASGPAGVVSPRKAAGSVASKPAAPAAPVNPLEYLGIEEEDLDNPATSGKHYVLPNEARSLHEDLGIFDTRGEVLNHLLQWEQQYCTMLSYVMSSGIIPMLKNGLMTSNEWRRIFRSVKEAAIISTELVQTLKNKLTGVDKKKLENVTFGEELSQFAQKMGIYNEYFFNQDDAHALLQQLSWSNSEIKTFLDSCSKDASIGKEGLVTWIRFPMAHAVCYATFARHLARLTPEDHFDEQACIKAQKHLENRTLLLEDKREEGKAALQMESSRIKNIEASLVNKKGEPVPIANSGRRVVKQATLRQLVIKSNREAGAPFSMTLKETAAGKKRFKKREVYLLNDMIIIAGEKTPKGTCKVAAACDLRNVSLINHADALDMVNAFEVVVKTAEGEKKGYVLLCATSTDKKEFTNILKREIKEYQDLTFRKSQLEKGPPGSSSTSTFKTPGPPELSFTIKRKPASATPAPKPVATPAASTTASSSPKAELKKSPSQGAVNNSAVEKPAEKPAEKSSEKSSERSSSRKSLPPTSASAIKSAVAQDAKEKEKEKPAPAPAPSPAPAAATPAPAAEAKSPATPSRNSGWTAVKRPPGQRESVVLTGSSAPEGEGASGPIFDLDTAMVATQPSEPAPEPTPLSPSSSSTGTPSTTAEAAQPQRGFLGGGRPASGGAPRGAFLRQQTTRPDSPAAVEAAPAPAPEPAPAPVETAPAGASVREVTDTDAEVPPGFKRLRFRFSGQEFATVFSEATTLDDLLNFAASKAGAVKTILKLETLELKARHLKYLQDNDVIDIITV